MQIQRLVMPDAWTRLCNRIHTTRAITRGLDKPVFYLCIYLLIIHPLFTAVCTGYWNFSFIVIKTL